MSQLLRLFFKKFLILGLFGIAAHMQQLHAESWNSFYQPNMNNRWKRDMLRAIVGFDGKKDISGADLILYAENLCTLASALYAQDYIIWLTHSYNETSPRMDQADAELTKVVGPDETLAFSPQSREALAVSLIYRNFAWQADILRAGSGQEIRSIVALLSKSSDKEVQWIAHAFDAKLQFALVKREIISLREKIIAFVSVSDWWTDYMQDKKSTVCLALKNTIREKIAYFSKLITDGRRLEVQQLKDGVIHEMRYHRQRKQTADVVHDYELVRSHMQELYAALIAELSWVISVNPSLQKYAYRSDVPQELLPGMHGVGNVLADAREKASPAVSISCGEQTAGAEKEKKKRKRHKKKNKEQTISGQMDAASEQADVLGDSQDKDEADEVDSAVVSSAPAPQKAINILEELADETHEPVSLLNQAMQQESPWIATFQDSKNKVTWHLYKIPRSEESPGLIELIYTSLGRWAHNIRGWLFSPEDEYMREGYRDSSSEKYKRVRAYYESDVRLHERVLLYHTFVQDIDAFIREHGQAMIRRDAKTGRDLMFVSVPGDVEFANATRQTGLFSFIIDADTGICFHRMFEPKELNWNDKALYQVALSDEALAALMSLPSAH